MLQRQQRAVARLVQRVAEAGRAGRRRGAQAHGRLHARVQLRAARGGRVRAVLLLQPPRITVNEDDALANFRLSVRNTVCTGV